MSNDEELFKKYQEEERRKKAVDAKFDEMKARAIARAKAKGYNTSGSAARRDIQIHAAVTITNMVGGVQMLGEENRELCQYAAAFTAPKKTPTPRIYIERAFDEMKAACLQNMREAGLILE